MTYAIKNLVRSRVLHLSLSLTMTTALAACGGSLSDEAYEDYGTADAEATVCPNPRLPKCTPAHSVPVSSEKTST